MRVFSHLSRFACFAALGTGLTLSVVWCWVHAHFLALDEGRTFFRPFTGSMLSCGLALGVRALHFSHVPHAITIVLVFNKGSTPRLRAMILSGYLSKNMVDIPYITEVVTQFLCHLLFQVDSLKEICEETLRKDIDNDTVLLCLGVAEQFSVSRLKVRIIDVPYSNYKLSS